MSYILDALKKAEAERNPDARASLAIEASERRKQRLLVYLVVCALTANAVLVLWIFLPDEDVVPTIEQKSTPAEDIQVPLPSTGTTPPVVEAPAPATAPVAAAAPALSNRPTATTEPISGRAPIPAPTPPPTELRAGVTIEPPPSTSSAKVSKTLRTEPPGEVTPIPATPDRVPVAAAAPETPATTTLARLPDNVRRDFPELTFSTHIYADDPELRAVVVNGVRLTEGDRLENLVVHEITEDGAVFSFDGYLVEVPVLETWN
jgi:general secretion pathway protein B